MQPTLPIFPAPPASAESKLYWDATARGELLIKRCGDCREAHFYPRSICPFCGSDATRWETACGLGTIYTYTIVRRWDVPAAIGFVELDEGPRILTLIAAANLDRLAIGQRVRARFTPAEQGFSVVVFERCSDEGTTG